MSLRPIIERCLPYVCWHGPGTLVFTDGGEKFQRVSGTQLSSSAATWIEFHPSDPEIIYAGSNIGAFRTMDGGKNWKWIYYETLRAANYITSIALDPRDPNIAYLSTYDGLFGTSDGGKTWTRPGAFLFTSARLTGFSWIDGSISGR